MHTFYLNKSHISPIKLISPSERKIKEKFKKNLKISENDSFSSNKIKKTKYGIFSTSPDSLISKKLIKTNTNYYNQTLDSNKEKTTIDNTNENNNNIESTRSTLCCVENPVAIQKDGSLFYLRKLFIIPPNEAKITNLEKKLFFEFYYPLRDSNFKFKIKYLPKGNEQHKICKNLDDVTKEIKKFLSFSESYSSLADVKIIIYNEDFNLLMDDNQMMKKSEKDKKFYAKIVKLTENEMEQQKLRCKFHTHKKVNAIDENLTNDALSERILRTKMNSVGKENSEERKHHKFPVMTLDDYRNSIKNALYLINNIDKMTNENLISIINNIPSNKKSQIDIRDYIKYKDDINKRNKKFKYYRNSDIKKKTSLPTISSQSIKKNRKQRKVINTDIKTNNSVVSKSTSNLKNNKNSRLSSIFKKQSKLFMRNEDTKNNLLTIIPETDRREIKNISPILASKNRKKIYLKDKKSKDIKITFSGKKENDVNNINIEKSTNTENIIKLEEIKDNQDNSNNQFNINDIMKNKIKKYISSKNINNKINNNNNNEISDNKENKLRNIIEEEKMPRNYNIRKKSKISKKNTYKNMDNKESDIETESENENENPIEEDIYSKINIAPLKLETVQKNEVDPCIEIFDISHRNHLNDMQNTNFGKDNYYIEINQVQYICLNNCLKNFVNEKINLLLKDSDIKKFTDYFKNSISDIGINIKDFILYKYIKEYFFYSYLSKCVKDFHESFIEEFDYIFKDDHKDINDILQLKSFEDFLYSLKDFYHEIKNDIQILKNDINNDKFLETKKISSIIFILFILYSSKNLSTLFDKEILFCFLECMGVDYEKKIDFKQFVLFNLYFTKINLINFKMKKNLIVTFFNKMVKNNLDENFNIDLFTIRLKPIFEINKKEIYKIIDFEKGNGKKEEQLNEKERLKNKRNKKRITKKIETIYLGILRYYNCE